ncbi:MAG: M48 family metallopeptidase [Ignavibacteriales bacterium]|nr:MAG: M48 family metallopeptidase [Ignavibacteriaceae bacterium]MBV6444108.1 hypothetical protein [Ignavibacteriaceae bacterium]MBW7874270.1 M48 family metallopeptidase [Ignavibacteria bacterium]MCZ2143228.1 M48 family metallopeptidase [Ignavibacteriales bacterium]WKZ72444.1 MAG: M48 family metallopeptidase [Ignavibacteriaceae bacterium]
MSDNSSKIKVKVGEHEIECTVRRSQRARRYSLKVSQLGLLEIVIPYRGSFDDGIKFLQSRREFIEKNLHYIIKDKDLPFTRLGKEIKITHLKDVRAVYRHSFIFDEKEAALKIISPPGATETINELYVVWLGLIAKDYLIPRGWEVAKKHGFQPSNFRVRKLSKRWGHCSSKKEITLSTLLVALDPVFIDHIILHELCHLKVMDHSPAFYAEFSKHSPNHTELDTKLKSVSLRVF